VLEGVNICFVTELQYIENNERIMLFNTIRVEQDVYRPIDI